MVPSCSPTGSIGRSVRATWEMRDKVCRDSVLARKFRTGSRSPGLKPLGKVEICLPAACGHGAASDHAPTVQLHVASFCTEREHPSALHTAEMTVCWPLSPQGRERILPRGLGFDTEWLRSATCGAFDPSYRRRLLLRGPRGALKTK